MLEKKKTRKVPTFHLKSVDELLQDAVRGDATAQMKMGDNFYNRGRDRNFAEALKWYQMAAAQGHLDAQFRIASIYMDGRDTDPDYEVAIYWLMQAAKNGHLLAQCHLAKCYVKGLGVRKGADQAVTWLNRAKIQAQNKAQTPGSKPWDQLDKMNYVVFMADNPELSALMAAQPTEGEEGSLVLPEAAANQYQKEDRKTSNRFARPASRFSSLENDSSLVLPEATANQYQKEDRKTPNRFARPVTKSSSFTEMLSVEAERGDPIAQHDLGMRYAKGHGVIQDEKIAAAWYQKSADQGYAKAQYELGVAYEKGRGVDQDAHFAAGWYRKAAVQGHEEAQWRFQELTKTPMAEAMIAHSAIFHRRASSSGVGSSSTVPVDNMEATSRDLSAQGNGVGVAANAALRVGVEALTSRRRDNNSRKGNIAIGGVSATNGGSIHIEVSPPKKDCVIM